jgi:hypothetical protein
MAASETIEALAGALLGDERILNSAEREILSRLWQRANRNLRPEDGNVSDAIAGMVLEIVSERASGILEDCLTRQMVKEFLGEAARGTTIPSRAGGPAPLPPPPTPNKAPRPPGPTPPGLQFRDLTAASPRVANLEPALKLGGPAPALPPAPSPDAPRPTGPTPPGGHIRSLPGATETRGFAHRASLLPAQCVLLEEFLAPDELQSLIRETLAREGEFQISEVIAPGVAGGITDFEHRRSRVLLDLGTRHDAVLDRLQGCLPRVVRKLGRDCFRASRVEMQITASNDGDFFSWHCDDAEPTIASREITFVYFFHNEPKKFRGGELRIYDSRWENGGYVPTENYRAIVPQQNQVVMFASCLAHEITLVDCPSGEFADSRFTVNGWFHR